MKCKIVREAILRSFDAEEPGSLHETIRQHVETCLACRTEWKILNETREALEPHHRLGASPGFKERVMKATQQLNIREMSAASKARPVGRMMLAAAMAVLLILGGSFLAWHATKGNDQSAMTFKLLQQASAAMKGLSTMHIEALMRTSPTDNFERVELNHDPIRLDIWKEFSDPPKWRFEKAGRTVVMDGAKQTLLINTADAKYVSVGEETTGYVEWLMRLLEPEELLNLELELAQNQPGAKASMVELPNANGKKELVVTIEAKAEGQFPNDWLKNSSIQESDNRRVYRFDAETSRLLGLEVWVLTPQGPISVLKTESITFNEPIAPERFVAEIPADAIRFKEVQILQNNEAYAAMGPAEMVRAFIQSCSAGGWNEALKYTMQDAFTQEFMEHVQGMELLEVGEPFQAGVYGGWFVPYRARYRDGHEKQGRLAVRNDNAAKRYVWDGGDLY